ncbi:MAG: hypothetical protein V1659_02440 [Candidatus Woesearchaeota archaeon]
MGLLVEFQIKEREKDRNSDKYPKNSLDIAFTFSKRIYKEIGTYLKAIVLFGSTARRKQNSFDVDILLILDDVTIQLTPEILEAYKIITDKIIMQTSNKLHVTTLKLTSFWEYVRVGDPIAINIMRDGVALIDTGFFEPLRILLKQGRIRPTSESVWTYLSRAPMTIQNSKWHILQAVVDLYWAVIDAAHSALMHVDSVPPSPEFVAELMRERLVKPKLISSRYPAIVDRFYSLSKAIMRRQIKDISGAEFDSHLRDAEDFVSEMERFVKGRRR